MPARLGDECVELRDGRVEAVLYIARNGVLPQPEWLVEQLGTSTAPSGMELLAGRPATPRADRGAIVCACFGIGIKTIISAIGEQQLTSVEAVGAALSAGNNCGSCRPAIRRLVEQAKEVAHG